jgi:predicted kinase
MMPGEAAFDMSAAIAAAKPTLSVPAPVSGQPALVMLCGLPGTGKSTLARQLAGWLPAVVIEADRMRQTLFAPPTYSAEESRRVHALCHFLIGWYLGHTDRQGQVHQHHVIYDATNLYEYHRELVYQLAERKGAQLVIVEVTASDEVIRGRLAPRGPGNMPQPERKDYSDADWEVYLRMRQRAEPIRHEHMTLDTSDGDLDRAVALILAAIKAYKVNITLLNEKSLRPMAAKTSGASSSA